MDETVNEMRAALRRLAGVVVLLPALVAPRAAVGEGESDLGAAVRAIGLSPEQVVFPARISEEMKGWLHERLAAGGEPERRLRRLLGLLLDPKELGVRYDPGANGTAEEVFSSGRANCLAFTHLFVGMAREAGLDAYYLEVRRRPRYEQEGDLVVVWEHVTAGYGPENGRLVLEFSQAPPLVESDNRRLSDLTAMAMYYSNRGAELLLAGEAEPARRWLETAVRLDPSWSRGWLNLGVARRRAGELVGAEEAYRAAIEADPDNYQAYHNLSALFRLRGDRGAARRILWLLDRRDNRDPYIYLALGDDSVDAGRLGEARRFYRRALRYAADQPEPRAAMGLLELAEGHPARARRWLERALRVGGESDRRQRLAERLGQPPPEPPTPLQSGQPERWPG